MTNKAILDCVVRNSFWAIMAAALLAGCVGLNRSPDSGYDDPGSNRKSGSSGFAKKASVEMNAREEVPESSVDIKVRLKQLENQVSSRRDLDQYSKALPWFHNDSEKIDFLSVGTYEARQLWLQNHNFSARQKQVTEDLQEVVKSQDIVIGMPENLVKKSWGDPQSIEVSGKSAFRNQRWHYLRNVSTAEGFKSEKKSVYFEGGKVVGWEVD